MAFGDFDQTPRDDPQTVGVRELGVMPAAEDLRAASRVQNLVRVGVIGVVYLVADAPHNDARDGYGRAGWCRAGRLRPILAK